MRISPHTLIGLLAFSLLIAVGCGGSSGPAKTTTGGELKEYLNANPQVATEQEEEVDDEADVDYGEGSRNDE